MKRTTLTAIATTCVLCFSMQSCHIGQSFNSGQFKFQSSSLTTQILPDYELDIITMEQEIERQQKTAKLPALPASYNYPQVTNTFLGHTIDGSAIDFAKILIKYHNYKYEPDIQEKINKQFAGDIDYNILCLDGEYDNRTCHIILAESQATRRLTHVGVLYSEGEKHWRRLMFDYLNLKDQFNATYGEGNPTERFMRKYITGKNKIKALCNGNGKWETVWSEQQEESFYEPLALYIIGIPHYWGLKKRGGIFILYSSQNYITHNMAADLNP